MAQILVRHLGDGVVRRLKERARRHGRSLQAEVKTILDRAAAEPEVDLESARAMIEAIRAKFKGREFPDSAELVREDRDR